MKIAIIGGSAAGMFTSLILARAGHEVLVFERDHLKVAPDVESAASQAFRSTAPQIVQPHIVMARCRQLLLEHLPDVYDGLLAAGVAEAPISTQMPPSLADTSPLPGDERLTLLMTRRSTVDWVLRRAIVAEPRIEVRYGTTVIGLIAVPGQPPHVTGIRTKDSEFGADLVVDASGYRSPIDRWLQEIGARPAAKSWAECGIAYFSRNYRFRPGAKPPGIPQTRIVAGLDEFNAGIWGADNGTMQMAVAPLAVDHRFKTLMNPNVFTAVLRTIPTYSAWLDALEPISNVYTMGGLHNTLRRLVADGAPVVTGLHTVGDSVCTTNPTLGRGLSLALSDALDLRDTIEKFPDDRIAQTQAMDALVGEHVAPFYKDQAIVDAERMAMLRHIIFNAPRPDPPPALAGRVTFAQLRAAAQFDPTAFRALWRLHGMISLPEEIYTDPQIVETTRATLVHYGTGPSMAQPTREQLLAALAN